MANAQETVNGIIVTYDGAETSYMLEQVPSIKCETVEGVQYAVLSLKDVAEPVLRVAVADGKSLEVVFGEYVPTGIETVTITERNGKKFINGGKLIIIAKDGKKYDTTGVEIK